MSSEPGRTIVYTDGACSGNPGPGGWAWVVPEGESSSGSAADTTNQRMELRAVLEAVRALDGPLEIHSDSTYVVNCFRDNWWQGWLKRGWKNSQKKPVANRDLWEPLIELYEQRDLTFVWVKGHSGDRWNDAADQLAVAARDGAGGAGAAGAGGAGAGGAGAGAGGAGAGAGGAGVAGAGGAGGAGAGGAGAAVGVAVDDGALGGAAAEGRRIAVFGHRPPELGGYGANPVADRVRRHLVEIISAKAEMFDRVTVLTGLGLGAEQLGAEAAIEAGASFVAVLAFPDPAARWPKPSQVRFDELLDAAVDVVIVDDNVPKSTAEAAKKFSARDRWLQSEADEAIAVYDGQDRALGASVRAFEQALGADVWILNP